MKQKILSLITSSLVILLTTKMVWSQDSQQTVEDTAKKTSVHFKKKSGTQNKFVPYGSGVIVKKEGNIYYVLTVRHVICPDSIARERQNNPRKTLAECEKDFPNFKIVTSDNQEYDIINNSVSDLSEKLDAVILRFQSDQNYAIAKPGDYNQLEIGQSISIFGWLIKDDQAIAQFKEGVFASKNPPNRKPQDNFTFEYSSENKNWDGISGGGIFNQNSLLIGLHKGAKCEDQSRGCNEVQLETKYGVDIQNITTELTKIGINLPTPSVEISTGNNSSQKSSNNTQSNPITNTTSLNNNSSTTNKDTTSLNNNSSTTNKDTTSLNNNSYTDEKTIDPKIVESLKRPPDNDKFFAYSINPNIGNPASLKQLLTTKECVWCNLRSVKLPGAFLSNTILSASSFNGADLSNVNLSGSDLKYADFSRANLINANLTNANLYGANFAGANLTGANFAGANLNGANFKGAIMPDGKINY